MVTVERSSDRRELVRAAGFGTTSWLSVLAGTVVAVGAVSLLLTLAAGLGDAFGFRTDDLNGDNWDDLGIAAAAVFAVAVFLGWFFGGYVAGRLARRAGVRHGALVVVLGLVVVAGIAVVAEAVGDRNAFVDDLRDQGVPTEGDDWSGIGIGAGVAVLAAMVTGALLGAVRGEWWHQRLTARAADPNVLPRGEDPDPSPAYVPTVTWRRESSVVDDDAGVGRAVDLRSDEGARPSIEEEREQVRRG
jgi:hypothetical protein